MPENKSFVCRKVENALAFKGCQPKRATKIETFRAQMMCSVARIECATTILGPSSQRIYICIHPYSLVIQPHRLFMYRGWPKNKKQQCRKNSRLRGLQTQASPKHKFSVHFRAAWYHVYGRNPLLLFLGPPSLLRAFRFRYHAACCKGCRHFAWQIFSVRESRNGASGGNDDYASITDVKVGQGDFSSFAARLGGGRGGVI